jgi:hypothetical protein
MASQAKDSLKTTKEPDTIGISKEGDIPIFYNMYLSVEMSSLFKSIGATYNEKLLNSPDRVNTYTLSTDKSLNLGAYAVDLCYARYFDQLNQAGKYLKSMHTLSSDLGIPDNKFVLSLKRIEININNKDSLIKIANELYTSTQKHLKESERESAAALVIAGGWTETMYIAVNLAVKPGKDTELLERIAEQKHSLKDLIDLLKKNGKELAVKEFLSKLNDIQTDFDKLNVDKNTNETKKLLDIIRVKINSLRKDMVS